MRQNGLMEIFDRSRRAQLELCDQLEIIADSLPERVDRQTCALTAQALDEVIRSAHAIEEAHVFPLVTREATVEVDSSALVAHLRQDHLADAFLVEELVELLASYGSGTPLHGPEASGYMLRSFFGGLRRHLALEQELLGKALGRLDSKGHGGR